MPETAPDTYALIPAAGTGTRMGLEIPKQYQALAGKPMICHAIETLCSLNAVQLVFVVLAPGDTRFREIEWGSYKRKVQPLYCGGDTRAASVLNGLIAMAGGVDADDWVMVHDAARPCVTPALLNQLMAEVTGHDTGGLLAVPVADTLKRADGTQHVEGTVSREQVWQAQTPQMFRHGLLLEALRRAGVDQVTDESSAVELLGRKPRLVLGSPRNLKVTRPEDSAIAEIYLKTGV